MTNKRTYPIFFVEKMLLCIDQLKVAYPVVYKNLHCTVVYKKNLPALLCTKKTYPVPSVQKKLTL